MDRHVATDARPLIDWAVAQVAMTGELRSGDVHVFQEFPGGVLVAVIDGLGHGEEAGLAADLAARAMADHAEEAVESLVRRCHQTLRGTRGAAMSLASFDWRTQTVTCLAIGNVEGVLVRSGRGSLPRSRESLILRGGVVGYSLPMLRTSIFPVGPGDTLVLATDGIRPGFVDAIAMGARPKQVANAVLASFGKDTDDALVLVARVEGDRR